MMHLDRIPTISVGILVPPGAVYDSHHHWRDGDGGLHASVRFEAGGYSGAHIQGDPVALRGLAAALHLAADQADQADATGQSDPAHPAAEAVVGS
jgi:hypothetical protein